MPIDQGRLSTEPRKFSQIVADLRHVVFSVIRERPNAAGGVGTIALGTGFFIGPNVFITCAHVINPSADSHRQGDSYLLIANLTGSTARIHRVDSPTVGNEISLYPDLDLAILKVSVKGKQPFASFRYDDVLVGEEIGITGYPLAQLDIDATGNLSLNGLIYRCGRGVVTGRYEVSHKPGVASLPRIETNFMFVSGNSGGPVFCPETGQVVGMVQMVSWAKIADAVCDVNPVQQLPLGLQPRYLSAVLAIYSAGIKLDAFRAALESSGVTP